ncbi:MAG: hypothetical protein ACI81R_002525 [Bradymonadia bacterium]|jgi:hypothetical protein
MTSRRTAVLYALALAVLLAGSLAAGCSSDGETVEDVDVTVDVAVDAGPSDDAERTDVEVPTRQRQFRMSISGPVQGLGTPWNTQVWEEVASRSDLVTITLEGGLPWAEILAQEPLPAEYESELALLAERTLATGLSVLLIVDPLNEGRTGFVSDALGREDVMSTIAFDNADFGAGYQRFCEDLITRFTPTFFVPIVAHNWYGEQSPDAREGVLAWYTTLFSGLTRQPVAVFPVWDFWTLQATIRNNDTEQLNFITRYDPLQALFGLTLYPALEGIGLDALTAEDFTRLDKNDRLANPVTTRSLALVGTSFPAEGFTVDGNDFASSENSQFNFIALILELADAQRWELVTWRVGIDPDLWLADPCTGAIARCDEEAATARYGALRNNGLLDDQGVARAASTLWQDYFDRMLLGGQ